MARQETKKTVKKNVAPATKKTKTESSRKTTVQRSKPSTTKKNVARLVEEKKAPESVKATTTISPPQSTIFNWKEIMMNMNHTKNFEKMSQDAANISKETMEACQKSASILAKNSQDCMTTYMNMMQSTAMKQSQLMKDMLGKKTINEMSETLQSASQDSFNEMMENMSKLSEQSIKAVMDSYEPLNNQLNKVAKKASENIAA